MPNLKKQRIIQQHRQQQPTKRNILSQPVATALIRAVSGRRSIACFVLGVRSLLPHFSHSKQHNRNMHGPHHKRLVAPRLPNFPVTHAKPSIQQHRQQQPTKRNILSQPVATALIRAVSGRRSIACFVLGVRSLLPHFSHSKQHNRNMHGPHHKRLVAPRLPNFPVTHAKPQKAKKHTAASSAAADKEKHPQPARRNCSHQGSQWKEKYCLFRPWCPLVAATFLTQQAT